MKYVAIGDIILSGRDIMNMEEICLLVFSPNDVISRIIFLGTNWIGFVIHLNSLTLIWKSLWSMPQLNEAVC